MPDLHGKIDALWTVDPDGTLTPVPVAQGNDDFGHGTAVASVIAATVDDGFGMAGFGGATHVITVHASTGTEISDTSTEDVYHPWEICPFSKERDVMFVINSRTRIANDQEV